LIGAHSAASRQRFRGKPSYLQEGFPNSGKGFKWQNTASLVPETNAYKWQDGESGAGLRGLSSRLHLWLRNCIAAIKQKSGRFNVLTQEEVGAVIRDARWFYCETWEDPKNKNRV